MSGPTTTLAPVTISSVRHTRRAGDVDSMKQIWKDRLCVGKFHYHGNFMHFQTSTNKFFFFIWTDEESRIGMPERLDGNYGDDGEAALAYTFPKWRSNFCGTYSTLRRCFRFSPDEGYVVSDGDSDFVARWVPSLLVRLSWVFLCRALREGVEFGIFFVCWKYFACH